MPPVCAGTCPPRPRRAPAENRRGTPRCRVHGRVALRRDDGRAGPGEMVRRRGARSCPHRFRGRGPGERSPIPATGSCWPPTAATGCCLTRVQRALRPAGRLTARCSGSGRRSPRSDVRGAASRSSTAPHAALRSAGSECSSSAKASLRQLECHPRRHPRRIPHIAAVPGPAHEASASSSDEASP